jgi:hypothetical protein
MSRYQEVKVATDRMDSNAYALWRNNPENRADVALLDSKDEQAPAPKERYAVLRPCTNCNRDVSVSSDYKELVFCTTECGKAYQKNVDDMRQEFANFKQNYPGYYDCPYNQGILFPALQEAAAQNPKLKWTASNIGSVFDSLMADGKLLPHISVKELNALTADDYQRRLQLDPALGGHTAKIDKKEVLATPLQRNAHVENPKPTTEMDFQDARNAVNRKVQTAAANYNSRYQTTRFVNGLPAEPETSTVAAVYRNGRRVI